MATNYSTWRLRPTIIFHLFINALYQSAILTVSQVASLLLLLFEGVSSALLFSPLKVFATSLLVFAVKFLCTFPFLVSYGQLFFLKPFSSDSAFKILNHCSTARSITIVFSHLFVRMLKPTSAHTSTAT